MIPTQPDAPYPLRIHVETVDGLAQYKEDHLRYYAQQNRVNAANFVIGYLNHALSRGIAAQTKDAREYAKELVDAGLGAYASLCRGLDDLE